MRYIILTAVAMSSSPCWSLKPSAFYVVGDDIISPAVLGLHIQALKAFKKESAQTGFQDSNHCHDFDQAHARTFNSQSAAHSEVAQDQVWQATEGKITPWLLPGIGKTHNQPALIKRS